MQIKAQTGRKKQSRMQRGIRRLVNIQELTSYGIRTYTGNEIVFFSLAPSNLSVLSPESLRAQINALMNVMKGVAEITMLCLNSRENYAENKRYLRSRIEEEENEAVREQLMHDMMFLDGEQAGMQAAREFVLVLYLPHDNTKKHGRSGMKTPEIAPYLSYVEQLVREQGFTTRRAEAADIMRILAMYFAQNTTSDVLEGFDGERFIVV